MNQVLSQDEINTLLKGLSEGDIEDGSVETQLQQNVKKFDLASQERIIRGRMPTLELIHERFARQFRTGLAKFLGRTCFTNVGGIEMVKFGSFMKKLPLPSSLHVVKMAPLTGQALVVVSAPFVFGVIDGLFGGKGQSKVKVEGREYTPIESRLIGKVVQIALELLREAWAPVYNIDFEYLRAEVNPFAITIAPPSDVVIVVNIEIELEQECTNLTICMPYSTLEPLRSKLSTSIQSTRLEVDGALLRRMQGNVLQTMCSMSVQLARGSIKTRDFLALGPGDIITLETNPTEAARIMVEGVPKFYGSVGSLRGNRAVRISKDIPKNDLINIRNKQELTNNGR
ncbi:MAG: flagellar motor switch protein FliM [Pseudomonadota bacterium]|jgi:flagellar motor switch protein FliM